MITPNQQDTANSAWLIFSLLTVVAWGLYGIMLHKGQAQMADPTNGRYKAFLWVGLAYFMVAVLAPLAVLIARGATWQMPVGGIAWSLVAGILGATGAFCVLLAFAARGAPSVVMSIVFAGAPVINACVAISLSNSWGKLRWQFIAGILLAAIGGGLVTLFRPS